MVDGRTELVEETQAGDPKLKVYLKEKLGPLLADHQFRYVLNGHLPGDSGSQARFPLLFERMKAVSGG